MRSQKVDEVMNVSSAESKKHLMNLRPWEGANPYWAVTILVSNNVIEKCISDWLIGAKAWTTIHSY